MKQKMLITKNIIERVIIPKLQKKLVNPIPQRLKIVINLKNISH